MQSSSGTGQETKVCELEKMRSLSEKFYAEVSALRVFVVSRSHIFCKVTFFE